MITTVLYRAHYDALTRPVLIVYVVQGRSRRTRLGKTPRPRESLDRTSWRNPAHASIAGRLSTCSSISSVHQNFASHFVA